MNTIAPATPSDWVAAVAQALERAANTYWQSFLIALMGSTFFEQIDWSIAMSLALATIPTAFTVLVAFVGDLAESAHWPPLAQAIFRVARTWAVVFLTGLGAGAWTLDVSDLRLLVGSAVAAAGAGALAAIKAELATFFGNKQSTALLPKRLDYDFALAA